MLVETLSLVIKYSSAVSVGENEYLRSMYDCSEILIIFSLLSLHFPGITIYLPRWWLTNSGNVYTGHLVSIH